MARVRCEKVSEGLRASEALAIFRDYQGRRHFIRVERDFLTEEGGHTYLPIGIVLHFVQSTECRNSVPKFRR